MVQFAIFTRPRFLSGLHEEMDNILDDGGVTMPPKLRGPRYRAIEELAHQFSAISLSVCTTQYSLLCLSMVYPYIRLYGS